jgi:hypothetical protein
MIHTSTGKGQQGHLQPSDHPLPYDAGFVIHAAAPDIQNGTYSSTQERLDTRVKLADIIEALKHHGRSPFV